MKRSGKPTLRTALRYVLCQLPGTLLAAVILLSLQKWSAFPAWLAWTLLALWILKDAALFPFVWRAYVAEHPPAPMVGKTGEARDRLDPDGYVRVGEEFWRAQLLPGAEALEPGDRVRVREQQGLTLIVEKETSSPQDD